MTLNLKEQDNPTITFISEVYLINSNKLSLIGEVRAHTDLYDVAQRDEKITTLAGCSNGLEAIILMARMSQFWCTFHRTVSNLFWILANPFMLEKKI